MRLFGWFERGGTFGTVVAAAGCASCFPALGSVAAALGLGFLAQFEGLFINSLLPAFAAVVFAAHLLALFGRRRVMRAVIGMLGPSMVLATLYLFWTKDWSTPLFYTGLGLMLIVGIWDWVAPARSACAQRARS